MTKTALITGVNGQDGSYLAEFLLQKGYKVHGMIRRCSVPNSERIDNILKQSKMSNKTKDFRLHYGDVTDSSSILKLIGEIRPDEIYNLAAMSDVKVSFTTPEYTANADGLGILRILESVKTLGLINSTKIYQASTSELFGKTMECPQKETTAFCPRSPYGVAKLYAYWTVVNYRDAYGLFACNGILFNHESPSRGECFVTRKITKRTAEIIAGLEKKLLLGNLNAKRDWGHARDYVEAMYMMLQQKVPEDFVIATGITTEVREVVRLAFAEFGIKICFEGAGIDEKGVLESIDRSVFKNKTGFGCAHLKKGQTIVEIDPACFRPNEVHCLRGDSTKALKDLGWKPKCDLKELIEEMCSSDLESVKKKMLIK